MVVGCSNDSKTLECGPGTVVSGSLCVPSNDGGPGSSSGGATNRGGAGGAAANGGVSAAGTPSGGVTSNTAGADGGTANGGMAAGGMTSSGGNTNAGGDGGDASTPDAGRGGSETGDGGSAPALREAHWLAVFTDAAYAYDLTKLGDAAAATRVGSYFTDSAPSSFHQGEHPSPWSPDGRWLLAVDSGALVVRDMSGAAPGASTPLGQFSNVSAYWSADSKSLATLEGGGALSTINPFETTPIKKPIANNVQWITWAPKGNLLYYYDGSQHFVVPVIAGIPGTPQQLTHVGTVPQGTGGELYISWLPDGAHLLDSIGDGAIWDVTGTTPKSTPIAPMPVGNPRANFDGSFLAFALTSSSYNYYAPLSPSGPGDAKPLGTNPIGFPLWSPVSNVLVTQITQSNPTPYVTLFGTNGPSTPIALPDGAGNIAFSPGAPRIVFTADGVYSFDVSHPQQDPVTLLPAGEQAPSLVRFSNDGKTIAYPYVKNTTQGVRIQDSVTAAFSLAAPGLKVNDLAWSPGGSFVAMVAQISKTGSANVLLVRVDGTDASAPVTTTTNNGFLPLRFAFQPTH
jgi:hypothetical protein